MVPMDKTLQDFGADVQWDDYAQMFTIAKDGAFVKVKPGAKTAIVNGKTLKLEVPVGRALWLVCRESDRTLPKIAALRRWLLQEIASLK